MGVAHELRVLFHHQGAGWGGAGLMRSTGAPAFAPDEVAFARRIAPIVTGAVRAALVRVAPSMDIAVQDGPAVLVIDADEITEATPAATRWLEALTRTDAGHGDIPAVVRAVAAHALSGRTVAQRARGADGTWVVLRAAPLASRRAVVTLEVAAPPAVASIISAALGLTGREVEVVTAVLKGRSTRQIGTELGMSVYTVQDHLKAVFAKAQVGSRRELVAEVFFGIYAPRLGSAVGVDGFFR
jgi:DNA-binding NarL/FixJ family response regulator